MHRMRTIMMQTMTMQMITTMTITMMTKTTMTKTTRMCRITRAFRYRAGAACPVSVDKTAEALV